MEPDEVTRLEAEAEEIATRIGDLRSLALLQMLRSARPGLAQTTADWIAGVERANRLADESGDDYLRVAIHAAGAYAYLCAADFERLDRTADEVLELAGDDHGAGAGIIIGCPVAWALMGEGDGLPRARRPGAGRAAAGEVAADRRGAGRSRDGELEPRCEGDAPRDAGRGRSGRGDGAPQLRADRAARRRLLAQPGTRQPRHGTACGGGLRRGAGVLRRGRAPATAKRWAAATSRRPGARRCAPRR